MIKKRFISMLVLLCLTVSGAWAQVTLLTTIFSTGDNKNFTSGSKTFDNKATVTFSGNVDNDGGSFGWCSGEERTLTVTAAEGYNITRVKFYNLNGSASDVQAPFVAILVTDGKIVTKVNGTSIGVGGVNKIEVYGYAGPPVLHYPITVKEGTEDATSWQVKAGTGEYQALPLEGAPLGRAVSVKYNGTKLVKSVKGKKNPIVEDKGKLICTDGHIHAYGEDAECTKARVAKIIYVGPTGHATYKNGLALALTDEPYTRKWGEAMTACNNKNTSTPVTDATWLLASKDQWDYMLGTNGAGSWIALREGFSSVGGSNMQSGSEAQSLYWSSTEHLSDEDEYDEAWCYVFSNGHWGYNRKANYCRARACLAFLAKETVTLNHSANNTWAIAEMPAGDVELEMEYFNITAPTANTANIYAGRTTPLINAGSTTEDGATMKYLVTATNEQPTSTDGFSTDVPTAQGRTAGTYYVWYYLDFESGDDSDISALAVEVTVKPVLHYAITVKEGTEDATSWQVKAGEGNYQALPLEGAALGTAVSVKYSGRKLVKSVKGKTALNLTSPAVGQVIGHDGKNYDYASLPVGVTAVAKICYVSGSNGLALALADEGEMIWSTAISTCAAHTPAFTGGTWKLATQDEWNNMITAAGSHTALRDGFSSVGGSNMQPVRYWSSTEYNSVRAWCYSFGSAKWYYDLNDIGYIRVRACLAFGAQETVTLNHSANNTWAQETVTLNHSANNTWAIAEMPYGDVELEMEYFNITVPTANTADIYAGWTTPLINAGSTTEDGATMKYLVTATNEQPTSTDGFSTDVPTAQAITGPGTYYVWYYLDLASGADSDISALAVEVTVSGYTVTMKEGTLDATSWQGKAGEGEYQALPLEDVAAGTAVSVKYSGTKKVKSVKAKAYKMAVAATSADKGKLICTSGHIHANGADAACTKARVAKIIYIGTTGHATYTHGLALALTDEGQMAWQAAIDACSAKNTSTPVTGATWLLASSDQWGYMMGADGAGSSSALRDGFSSVGGSNLQSAGYWSGTESVSGYAWYYDFGYGNWGGRGQGQGDVRVRACLAF